MTETLGSLLTSKVSKTTSKDAQECVPNLLNVINIHVFANGLSWCKAHSPRQGAGHEWGKFVQLSH